MPGDAVVVMTVTTGGLVDAVTKLDRMDGDMRDMQSIGVQMDTALVNLINDLIAATPVAETGRLQEGWDVEEVGQVDYELERRIVNRAPHATFVIQGTGIYGPEHQMIAAQPGRPFVFTWRGRRFKLMQHKGQSPNVEINELLDSIPDVTFRAAGRGLRGLVDVLFTRQAQPYTSLADVEAMQTVPGFEPEPEGF